MGSSATNSRLHTAVTSCPGLELDQQPPMLKAEIQNQYLLYVLLLEVSLSLTSLKCFWLEAAEDTGLLLTQILSTPFVDSACTVTQHIDVKACLNCRLLVSITTTVFAFFCKIWNMAWIFITALVSCF